MIECSYLKHYVDKLRGLHVGTVSCVDSKRSDATMLRKTLTDFFLTESLSFFFLNRGSSKLSGAGVDVVSGSFEAFAFLLEMSTFVENGV